MNLAIVVATLGRPAETSDLITRLRNQTAPPHKIILSVESSRDVPPDLASDIDIVYTPRGLPRQRNAGLRRLPPDTDLVMFYDDDFLPSRRALEGAASLFAAHPDIVSATGLVLADGVTIGGLSYETSAAILEDFDEKDATGPIMLKDVRRAYGCNMAFRVSAIKDIWFDENLPLYGWQEDVDFAAQLLPRGRVVETNAFAGVHRGVTHGRTSGVRLGFSQVINPVYLAKKGTMAPGVAAKLMLKNIIANHVRAPWPEPWIDRLGRARGNWLGLLSVLQGRVRPQDAVEL